jgi:iron complex outermembrane receptor protein
MDAPFSQTGYTAQLIEDQQARSLGNLLMTDPSARMSLVPNDFEKFTVRALPMVDGNIAFNGLYGIAPVYRVPVELVQGVELLKRADDAPLTCLATSYQSDALPGLHLDVGRRFGVDNAFGIRLNLAGRQGDTSYERQRLHEHLFSLGLDYRGERLRVGLDVLR